MVKHCHKNTEALDYVQCHGKLPTWDEFAASNPEHQWAANFVNVVPAGWLPVVHVGFLKLCKVKAKTEDPIGSLLRSTKTELAKLAGVTFTCGSHNPTRFHVKDPAGVQAWLESINPKLINRSATTMSKTEDGIETTTSKRRAGGSKKKASKKKAAAKKSPGRTSTFEHESDFLKMLKRKNGCSVTEASEKFGVEPEVIRKQIDRLRRGGNDITRGGSRGVFVLAA